MFDPNVRTERPLATPHRNDSQMFPQLCRSQPRYHTHLNIITSILVEMQLTAVVVIFAFGIAAIQVRFELCSLLPASVLPIAKSKIQVTSNLLLTFLALSPTLVFSHKLTYILGRVPSPRVSAYLRQRE